LQFSRFSPGPLRSSLAPGGGAKVLAAPPAEAVGGAFYGAGPQAASDVGELRRELRTGEVRPGHRDIVFINRCCPKPEAWLLLAALIWYYPYY